MSSQIIYRCDRCHIKTDKVHRLKVERFAIPDQWIELCLLCYCDFREWLKG
jgi:hypothetical protein